MIILIDAIVFSLFAVIFNKGDLTNTIIKIFLGALAIANFVLYFK